MNPDKRKLSKIAARATGNNQTGVNYFLRNYYSPGGSRRPSGLFSHFHDTYALRKFVNTVDTESRHCEAPFLLSRLYDQNTVTVVSQPEPVKITYVKDGKTRSHFATEDFLVLENSRLKVIECKPQSKMEMYCSSKPHLYTKVDGEYRCPPAQEAYRKMGIEHHIFTDADFSVAFTRNCYFLLNFIDKKIEISESEVRSLIKTISRFGNRIRLSDLYEVYGQNFVIAAILQNHIFFDQDKDLLSEPENTWIYHSAELLQALKNNIEINRLIEVTDILQLTNKHSLWIQTVKWDIVQFQPDPLFTLTIRRPDQVLDITRDNLRTLIGDGKLYIEAPPDHRTLRATEILCSRSSQQIEKARLRQQVLHRHVSNHRFSQRTISRWQRRYSEAISGQKDTLEALIDNSHKSGNRLPRLAESNINIMSDYFDLALSKSPGPLIAYFRMYVEAAEDQGIEPCSLKTFYERFRKHCPKRKQILKQKGKRAAYALGPHARELDMLKDIPYQGDYAFQIAHVDHTPIEMEFVSSLNGEPLKSTMYLSTLQDSYSHEILAIYCSFEAPSYRSTMMLLRECYARHKVLPQMLVFDRGSDFESVYLDRVLADLRIHKRRRAVGEFRSGSNIERLFHIIETEFIHLLRGNKQLQKLARGQSSTHKPIKQAVWTPNEFYIELREYCYLIYPNTMRAGIADTPRNRLEKSVEQFEEKPGVRVRSDFDFFLATLPYGKNDGFCQLRHNQIRFKNVLYRLSRHIEGVDTKKMRVQVKYNPYDIRYIWALVKDRWVKLTTTDTLVRECYDKHIQYPHLEVYPRTSRQAKLYRKGKSAPKGYFKSLRDKEKALFSLEQNQKDYVDDIDSQPEKLEVFDISDIEPAAVKIVEKKS